MTEQEEEEEEDAEGAGTQQKHQEAGLVPACPGEETRMEVTTGREATGTTVVAAKDKGKKEKKLNLFF